MNCSWQLQDVDSEGITNTLAKVGDQEAAGIRAIPTEAAGMPPMRGAYVTADDVDLSAKRTQELSGKVIVPPKEIPGVGCFCVIQDPQGATLSLIHYAPCEDSES